MNIKKMTTKKLKELAKELYVSVNVVECFSVRDVTMLDQVEAELYKRGWELLSSGVTFSKV